MVHTLSRRSFTRLAVFLLVLGFAVSRANAMARAPDPFAADAEPLAKTLTGHPACGDIVIEGCTASVKSRHAIDLAAPGPGMAPPPVAGHTVEINAFPELPVALHLQRNLFTRGGRLASVDVLTTAAEVLRPTERTAKEPGWAMQLRSPRERNANEKERG